METVTFGKIKYDFISRLFYFISRLYPMFDLHDCNKVYYSTQNMNYYQGLLNPILLGGGYPPPCEDHKRAPRRGAFWVKSY